MTNKTKSQHREIGQRIRDLRVKKGLSQLQLGKNCGFKGAHGTVQTYISGLELGKRKTNPVTLVKIAKALGTTVLFLMEGKVSYKGKMTTPPSKAAPKSKPSETPGLDASDLLLEKMGVPKVIDLSGKPVPYRPTMKTDDSKKFWTNLGRDTSPPPPSKSEEVSIPQELFTYACRRGLPLQRVITLMKFLESMTQTRVTPMKPLSGEEWEELYNALHPAIRLCEIGE